jgi:hypothetical protein
LMQNCLKQYKPLSLKPRNKLPRFADCGHRTRRYLARCCDERSVPSPQS